MSNTITPTVFYRTINVEELEIFYREAGSRNAPTVLLLHGFPSSSHMFRNLIPMVPARRGRSSSGAGTAPIAGSGVIGVSEGES